MYSKDKFTYLKHKVTVKNTMKSEEQKRILRSEKRIMLLGVGTRRNPVKPVPENSARPLLKKYSLVTVNEKTELHKIKEIYNGEIFLLNIISNPHLLKDEIRLAIYLLHRLYASSELFLTIEVLEFDVEVNYGEDGLLHVGKLNSKRYEEFVLDRMIINLLDELRDLKIKFTSARLIAALKRLHDFGYITITEINLANTYEGQKIHNRGKSRARLRHIRLSEEMQKKDISRRWLNKSTKHTKPKKGLRQ